MEVQAIPVGPLQANCYLVWDQSDNALVIDPGWNAELILETLADYELTPAAYILTHGHTDHICAVADLYDAKPAPVAIHPDDASWAFDEVNELPPFYPVPRPPAALDRSLEDNQELEDAGMRYRVIHTPGHTPGGVCLYFPEEGALFTGDTLFAGSIGRSDLVGGDTRQLEQSLVRLLEIPDDITIYPGHGPETTLAQEKRTNPFIRQILDFQG